MEINEIKNIDSFLNNNFNNIYMLNSIGFIKSDYDKVLLESPLINEMFNINETFIFRTNQKNKIIYYELYSEKLFMITIENCFIFNVFIILPNILLILTKFDKYYLNIKTFKFDKILKSKEDLSPETFILNNCENMLNSLFPFQTNKNDIDDIILDSINFSKINGKALFKVKLSSLSRFLICRCENEKIIYDLILENEIINFTINELIPFLNNKFYYLLHLIINIKK